MELKFNEDGNTLCPNCRDSVNVAHIGHHLVYICGYAFKSFDPLVFCDYRCSSCLHHFPTEIDFNTHWPTCKRINEFMCNYCFKCLVSKSSLDGHNRRVYCNDRIGVPSCHWCDINIPDVNRWKRHIKWCESLHKVRRREYDTSGYSQVFPPLRDDELMEIGETSVESYSTSSEAYESQEESYSSDDSMNEFIDNSSEICDDFPNESFDDVIIFEESQKSHENSSRIKKRLHECVTISDSDDEEIMPKKRCTLALP